MISDKQRKVREIIIRKKMAGEDIIQQEVLKEAGYSDSSAKNSTQTFRSRGIQDAMKEAGLTVERFSQYLAYDLENKPKERLGELKLMADVLDITSSKVSVTVEKGEEAMDRLASIMSSAEVVEDEKKEEEV